ncbi:uncharacterized protein LOC133191568 [Saccostrea echinata]|uniref:uncharacterized protein LOC133191568 n=1 Tax=Saccostrea echinata TaxID=191078 RepID=UPI002A82DD70|nr:uncharacterized protein LOC133191568 [Saccostrea echinata]
MGKCRAEIQKAYRERLKQKDNEGYLAKERARRRACYVPSAQLSRKKLKERNEKNRERLRRFYEKKRREREIDGENTNHDTSGYETAESGLLQVQFQFPNRKKGPQKRWKEDLIKARERIRELEKQNKETKRKNKSLQRRFQRIKHKISSSGNLTPRKEVQNLMKAAKLSEEQKNAVKKPLLLASVIAKEIDVTKRNVRRTEMKAVYSVVSGKIVKKYRCLTSLAAKAGLDRNRMSKVKTKSLSTARYTRRNKKKMFERKVTEFMEREDNSRAQPGKNDVKKTDNGEKAQTRVLKDYLENLYKKFKSENPEMKISLTTFKRIRPKNILLMALISRNTCLCTKHQNMALTAKELKAAGLNIPLNPEHMVKENVAVKAKEHFAENDVVKVNQWKRVEVEEKGKKKYVTKIMEQSFENIKSFLDFLNKQTEDFKGHVSRVSTQYEQIHALKGNLPQHNVVIQMDFAENYTCKSLEEVQSAYFNQTCVTLHPMVVYYPNSENTIEHKSIIVVSDEMGHNSTTVLTFIDKIMPIIKNIDPDVSTIHYWTDSPTSQYRNKTIIDFVANHKSTHGMNARWNYFESGHGKGPCDGLGGTVKRLADEAMRSGKVMIQDAKAFYDWAKSSSMKNVTFVESAECEKKKDELNAYQSEIRAVKGTMKLHAVVGLGNSCVKIKDVSCYCDECLSGNICSGWNEAVTRTVANENNALEEIVSPTGDSNVKLNIGDFVAAYYDVEWYVGKVVDKDDDDGEFEISFMEKRKELYRWPGKPDKLWVSADKIICIIDEPIPTGKYGGLHKLSNENQSKIAENIK